MRTIHRYPLRPGLNEIEMPSDAQVLTAQAKDGVPQLWALVESNTVLVTVREFYVAATGEDLDLLPFGLACVYVGTVQIVPRAGDNCTQAVERAEHTSAPRAP